MSLNFQLALSTENYRRRGKLMSLIEKRMYWVNWLKKRLCMEFDIYMVSPIDFFRFRGLCVHFIRNESSLASSWNACCSKFSSKNIRFWLKNRNEYYLERTARFNQWNCLVAWFDFNYGWWMNSINTVVNEDAKCFKACIVVWVDN